MEKANLEFLKLMQKQLENYGNMLKTFSDILEGKTQTGTKEKAVGTAEVTKVEPEGGS